MFVATQRPGTVTTPDEKRVRSHVLHARHPEEVFSTVAF